MAEKRLSFSKYDPLNDGDSLSQTFGCRCYNPDICRGNGDTKNCALYNNTQICHTPPKSWKRTYENLRKLQISEEFNQDKVVVHLEKDLKKMDFSKLSKDVDSIINLWGRLNCQTSVAVFKNINTDKYVKIYMSPLEQYKRYKKCYGKISSDGYDYSDETMQIFYADCREWLLIWYRPKKD